MVVFDMGRNTSGPADSKGECMAAVAKPEPLATPGQVAEVLGLPEQTLAQWRSQGKGPEYHKIGRHVRYEWRDVEAYIRSTKAGAAA